MKFYIININTRLERVEYLTGFRVFGVFTFTDLSLLKELSLVFNSESEALSYLKSSGLMGLNVYSQLAIDRLDFSALRKSKFEAINLRVNRSIVEYYKRGDSLSKSLAKNALSYFRKLRSYYARL